MSVTEWPRRYMARGASRLASDPKRNVRILEICTEGRLRVVVGHSRGAVGTALCG